jgi:hypothetical protein
MNDQAGQGEGPGRGSSAVPDQDVDSVAPGATGAVLRRPR